MRRIRSIGFFGLCSVILVLLAVVLFIPILITYFETGMVDRFPTLFVCGFIGLAALQSLFAGLMLSNMALKNRRDFEYRLTLVTRRLREK